MHEAIENLITNHTRYITPDNYEVELMMVNLDPSSTIACDIETTSLNVYEAELVSISFTDESGNTYAFLVKHKDTEDKPEYVKKIMDYLRDLILTIGNTNGTLVFHKANFDIPVLIKELFISPNTNFMADIKEKNKGIQVFSKINIEDTLIMHYLLFNSASGNKLGLKELVSDLIPDYKISEIKNVYNADKYELLKYNALDTIATYFLYVKYFSILELEDRKDTKQLYKELFIPILRTNIRTQLHGLPISIENLSKYEEDISKAYTEAHDTALSHKIVKELEALLRKEAVDKYNRTHKVKQITEEDKQAQVPFNPGSTQHVSKLLYDILNLPVIEHTPKGVPSASTKTLNSLIKITDNEDALAVLESLIQLNEVKKIYTAFLPTFLDCPEDNQGYKRLYSYFNLGGTISGRLSCNNFNQQQLPATGSKYAKVTKKIFKAPPGWLIVGSDFKSLENMISALTTKDPAKLSVYTQGYDGHCKNAYAYWGHLMPDIKTLDENSDVKCYIYEDTVLTEDDEVEYQGKIIKIKDLYT